MVPLNQPAIRWNPDTYHLKDGENCAFEVQGDNTWHVEVTDLNAYLNLTPKRNWSYDAEDFPVFGILLRNFWSGGGSLWYSAGEIVLPENGHTVSYLVYDGEFYGEDEEYVFIPIDLSDLWTGRINNIRLDIFDSLNTPEGVSMYFGAIVLCKTAEEAAKVSEGWAPEGSITDYLAYLESLKPKPEPETDAPTEAPTDPVTDPITDAPTEPATTPVTDAPTGAPTEAPSEGGCSSAVAVGVLALLPLAALCFLKKKD